VCNRRDGGRGFDRTRRPSSTRPTRSAVPRFGSGCIAGAAPISLPANVFVVTARHESPSRQPGKTMNFVTSTRRRILFACGRRVACGASWDPRGQQRRPDKRGHMCTYTDIDAEGRAGLTRTLPRVRLTSGKTTFGPIIAGSLAARRVTRGCGHAARSGQLSIALCRYRSGRLCRRCDPSVGSRWT
jgi:hypothetical protein